MYVRAEHISKEFIRKIGDGNIFSAVQDTDIEIEEGKLTVITGRSGSGKTTLMNMLAGLETPTTGRVLVDDTPLYDMDDDSLSMYRSKYFGYIPQVSGAISSLSVLENILLPYKLYDRPDTGYEYAMKLMVDMEIESLSDSRVESLSGGELRRMSIARAMVTKPSVIYADEPTGDLDDITTKRVIDIFKNLTTDGVTVIVVTHEKEIADMADVLYRMDGGTIELQA